MIKYKKENNPYTLQFSYIPPQFIERRVMTADIVDNFTRQLPTYRGMFITGVRGSGKTVMMGDIRNKIAGIKDKKGNKAWVTVDLNAETNLIDSLARGLYRIPELKTLFLEAKLDFSFLGIGVKIENAHVIASNEEDAIIIMLEALKKANKKVLVTIDEVTYNENIAKLSHALSSFANQDLDIYLLMTGLADNIKKIKNNPSLTFLYRAKEINLEPLNITAIRSNYQEKCGLSMENAEKFAVMTKGYSLAFQTLGFYIWDELSISGNTNDIEIESIYAKLDDTLAEFSYDKIFSELSEGDIKVLQAMAEIEAETGETLIKADSIYEKIGKGHDDYTKYRSRLIGSGIVDGSQRGRLRFILPRMRQYIENRRDEY